MSDSVLKASILWHVVALLVIAIWGTTFVSSKVLLLNGMHPADIFFYRFALAYLCMCMLSHHRLFASSITDELAFLGLGIFGGTMYFLAENTALIYSTANNVAILVCTTPLVTALILAFFYRSERMTRRQVMWSLLAFVGMALVVLNGQLVLHLNPLGDVLAFGASVAWAFYSLLMKRVMGHYSADFITRKVFFYGILTILPYYIFVHPLQTDLYVLLKPVVLSNIAFLGLIASMGCYLLWNWVMAKLGAVKASNYLYLQTLFAMLAAALVLNEHISIMALAGTFILLLGMYGLHKK